MKTTRSLLILLALGMILCSGCAHMTYSYYDGPRQPKTKVGTIKAGIVSTIGGKNISYLAGHKIEVLPGKHSLGLSGTTRTAEGHKIDFHCALQVKVEAGHIYEGFKDREVLGGKEIDVVGVTDTTANKIVAKIQPLPNRRRLAKQPNAAAMRLTPAPATGDFLATSF